MKTNETYTLITGASTGLGKEFAIESARRGRNLLLVALPGRNLNELCIELTHSFGIKALAWEIDLTDEKILNVLATEIISNYSVDQLINNAGIGGTSRFEDASVEYLDKIILLNIRVTTVLTRLMLPELLTQKKALIMNVASVAAFGPLPFKSIYPASKAFIYSFSRSLSRELHGTGVSVMVVAPGSMMTNPDVSMRLINHGSIGQAGIMLPGKVARLSLDGAEKGKKVVVPGFMNRLNRFLIWIAPTSLNLMIMERIVVKELGEKKSN